MAAEICERSGSSTGGTKEMSPRPRKHPVASSTRATWLPSRNSPGAPRKGNILWNWKKKKALPTGPGAASSSTLPCLSAGPWGWPVPTSLLLAHGRGCGAQDPALGPSQIPGSQPGSCQGVTQGRRMFPGAQRETEADVLGLAAPCSLWGGATTRKGPFSPPGRAQGSEPGFSP